MTQQNTQLRPFAARLPRPDLWSAGALVIALLVLAPILAVIWLAFNPTENIWPHMLSTVLPRYLRTTVILMVSVAVLAGTAGIVTAWLVTQYRFFGSRWLTWALLLPLGLPAYVGAYAIVDFMEYAGPVQGLLRATFGWTSSRDYWFPDIRSLPVAALVISMSLYPYVYLLTRAAFREQSGCAYEVARALGAGAFARFWRVGLPLARPALAAASAIVMMETVNDFGVVDYFGVQTLTTGIFSVWLLGNNAGGAAQLACVVLVLILALVAVEKVSRRSQRFYRTSRAHRPIDAIPLTGWRGAVAFAVCLAPFALGFVFPFSVMLWHTVFAADVLLAPGLLRALGNTLFVSGAASVLTVGLALFLVYGVRLSGRRLPRIVLPATTVGYAAPGAVLGLGVLIPMAALDNRVADAILSVTGWDPGLMLTGTSFALIFAYMVRFFAIAQGAADSAMGRISPSLPMAARSLGQTAGGTLARVYVPLMRGSVGTALLLVFVDSVKELPATLLLRPFNFHTLATRVHEQAGLEKLSEAAPAALIITLVGLCAVILLARTNR
jgi:iron(III) transport system permease protein